MQMGIHCGYTRRKNFRVGAGVIGGESQARTGQRKSSSLLRRLANFKHELNISMAKYADMTGANRQITVGFQPRNHRERRSGNY